MLAQMARHFNIPPENQTNSFRDYIYATQAVQSMCYNTALSLWRRIKHETPGHTMGAIFWQVCTHIHIHIHIHTHTKKNQYKIHTPYLTHTQLNDIWQGPSWSCFEYDGRWKQLAYHVKRVFAPVLVSMTEDKQTNTLALYITSDLPRRHLEGDVELKLMDWEVCVC